MAKTLRNLKVTAVALVDKGANQAADIVLFKRRQDPPPATVTTGDGAVVVDIKETAPMPENDVAKELADTQAKLAQSQAEVAALKESPVSPPTLAVAKVEFEKTKAELEKSRAELQKQLEVAQQELEDSRAEVEKIQRSRRREQFIKMAQGFKSLPGAGADDFAEILEASQAALTEKQFRTLQTRLTSWDKVMEKSRVFEEIGRAGGDLAALTGPEGRLHAIAKDLQAQNPKLSYEQAYARAMTENPDVYKQYRAEKGA